MIRDILVARDFSPSSERALTHALDLAERADAALHMLAIKVLRRDPFAEAERPTTPLDKLREWFKERSRKTVTDRGFDPGSVRIHHALMQEEAPGPAIVKYADENEVDLIALGTHGRRGLRRMLLGSVTEEVLRTAPCPVLVTRASEEKQDETKEATHRLIVPIDFSGASRAALRYAGQVAPLYDASLHLLHVIEDQFTPSEYELTTKKPKSADIRVRAERALNEWKQELSTAATSVTTQVERGRPEEGIIEAAADGEKAMIVMATQGRTGWRRTMMGSVAESVIRAAPCPVLAATSFPDAEGQDASDKS